MGEQVKYSDYFADCLETLGYTHCFFVAGGNIMHLLESCSSRFTCVPVVHEVTAAIAAEYFNEHSPTGRAFALVTAGPGLTNAITGIAGAWLESRELLVVGGQVKSTDLKTDGLRQRGIQEIDGVTLVQSICKEAVRIDSPVSGECIAELDQVAKTPRKGPVFIEMCLDVQAAPYEGGHLTPPTPLPVPVPDLRAIADRLMQARRPVFLLGGGITREAAERNQARLDDLGVPILTTWNGADRYASDRPMWFGRPDTWGMRGANIILQSADLVVALGCRLSLQQTGFNWQKFVPDGEIIHVDIDPAELRKKHPGRRTPVHGDADIALDSIAGLSPRDNPDWRRFCDKISRLCPLDEPSNSKRDGWISPYTFMEHLSEIAEPDDSIVPCSSGGANTVAMQAFRNKTGQRFFNNKALASMGYGLAGAIGAAKANPSARTVLIEGDGGFAQNLQDLATVAVNELNIKAFIFVNNGYASIRMTQSNYFGGRYVGCDAGTGLGSPDWVALAGAFGIDSYELDEHFAGSARFQELWNSPSPVLFLVPVDPEQTYYPKISSRVLENGMMESAPLDQMSPDASDSVREAVEAFQASW